MQAITGRKLLTCRYWAFGPRCPNIDAGGVDTCDYAHWDTGNLSNFYQQRGTCWYWANPKFGCWWGAACNFEHRETGYMGVHHGSKLAWNAFGQPLRPLSRKTPPQAPSPLYSPVRYTDARHATVLQLSGLNLQIADAARKSGFNIRNHIALLDLIWSVRRVALTHGVTKKSLPPPPKPPIYPDRHRLGAQGRKADKSRKRAREAEAQAHGTLPNPIDLDVDPIDNEYKSVGPAGAKRQKVTSNLARNSTATRAPSGPANPIHQSRFPNSRINNFKPEGKENNPLTRTIYMPSPNSLNLPPPRESPTAQHFQRLVLAPASSSHQPLTIQASNQQDTLHSLGRVSRTLSDNLNAINDCKRTMKSLYDTDESIRHHAIFDLLVKLNDDMQDSENGVLKALGDVDGVTAFLKGGGGRNSALGIDEVE